MKLLIFLFFTICFAQQPPFVRVFFIADGESETMSYFDYNISNNGVIRIQSINDINLFIYTRGSAATASSVVSTDLNAYSLVYIITSPTSVGYFTSLNLNTCQFVTLDLANSAPSGLAVDPANSVFYYGIMPIGNVTNQISGIRKETFSGSNFTNVYLFPKIQTSNWLTLDTQRFILYYSVANYQFSSYNLLNNVSHTYQTQCTVPSCDINKLGAVVDSISGNIYYPDTLGIVSFNTSTGITTRSFTAPNNLQVKGLTVDNVNNLIFMQMFATPLPGGVIADSIYVASINLATTIVNPATLVQIPGIIAYDLTYGNILSLAHCDNGACGVCGYPYIYPFGTNVVAAGSQFMISIVFLIVLLAILL